MVLLVPDDSFESEGEEQPEVKAELDSSETSLASQKVDLDLDDAPFLEDEDDEEEELLPPAEEAPLLDSPEPSGRSWKDLLRNKFVLIGIGALLIGVAVFFFFFTGDDEAVEPEPEVVEEVVEAPPPPTPEPEIVERPAVIITLAPFLVEQKDSTGEIRIIEITIAVSTLEDALAFQLRQETFAVRNALFYYLKNKDLAFLSNQKNSTKLKSELLAVINQYMGFGQFDELFFDKYLVR